MGNLDKIAKLDTWTCFCGRLGYTSPISHTLFCFFEGLFIFIRATLYLFNFFLGMSKLRIEVLQTMWGVVSFVKTGFQLLFEADPLLLNFIYFCEFLLDALI